MSREYEFFNKAYPEEVALLIRVTGLCGIFKDELFQGLIDMSQMIDHSSGCFTVKDWLFEAYNVVECDGHQSTKSSTSTEVYSKSRELILNINYDIETTLCCESRLLHFDVRFADNLIVDNTKQQEETNMASLSQRVEDKSRTTSDAFASLAKSKTTIKGENIMNTLRTITATLIDNNPNLKAKDRIVFQEKEFLTEYSDEDTLQNILATGDVKKAVIAHNEKRESTVDKAILKSTGKKVMLDPIELISELNWAIVRNA